MLNLRRKLCMQSKYIHATGCLSIINIKATLVVLWQRWQRVASLVEETAGKETPSRCRMKHTDDLWGSVQQQIRTGWSHKYIGLRAFALASDLPSTYEFETGRAQQDISPRRGGGGGRGHVSKREEPVRRFAYKPTSQLSNTNFTDRPKLFRIDFCDTNLIFGIFFRLFYGHIADPS
jgi:hypothetical protein